MRSIVIWTVDRDALGAMVRAAAGLGRTSYETSPDRWIIEFGDDDYVSLTAVPEIWDEYEEDDERRIRALFDAEPVAILVEYRDRETARAVLIAALAGVDAQIEGPFGHIVPAGDFRRELIAGDRQLS
ncbi:hypothetical protein ACQP2F_16695 [Actinoplanes sp. CA-030573]|uniref:hypothetical protein n=1 Tax=Actinoplanes sp. CA-030573 TaxID=3239898 RepID=UPI003D8A61A8